MNTRLKLMTTLGTLVFLGIGALNTAYADEYTTAENQESRQVFVDDYNAGREPMFFTAPAAPWTEHPLMHLRTAPQAPAQTQVVNPHWGPAEDATDF